MNKYRFLVNLKPPASPVSLRLISAWLIISNSIILLGTYLAYTKHTQQGQDLSDMLNGMKAHGYVWYLPVALYSFVILCEGIGIRYLKKWAWVILFFDVLYTLHNHVMELIQLDRIGFLLNAPYIINYVLIYLIYKHRKLFS